MERMNWSEFAVERVTPANQHLFYEQIVALEKMATYPIGDDFFQIDHGQDYFRFFQRMGEVYYCVATYKSKVVAVACGILRKVPFVKGGKKRKCWYLCDLKVHPDFRGSRIPQKMFRSVFFSYVWKSFRCYMISMNPAVGENRVVNLLRHFPWVPLRYQALLEIYSLSLSEYEKIQPVLEQYRGNYGLLSHSGVKDIVLQSTGKPMPLYHIQMGACAEYHNLEMDSRGVFMFATVENDSLSSTVKKLGIVPGATASIVAAHMKSDWEFILTSDI